MSFHIDIPSPHIDVPPPHIDVPSPHVDVGHIDIPPPHVDVGHIDIPPPHVDVGHIDVPPPHVDLGHIDVPPPHVDVGHIDVRPPHIDIPHVDLIPHIDVSYPPDPPAHVDTAPPHVDVGYNHWWQNWPKTHGYVAQRMFFPTSVAEIATAIQTAEHDKMPLRAVGGGWSFTDASLPGNVATVLAANPLTDRPNANACDAIDQFLPLAEGFPQDNQSSIASLDASNNWLTRYNSDNVGTVGAGASNVTSLETLLTPPQPQPAYLMNTRSLKSTLQAGLKDILSVAALAATATGSNQKFYFHVEAGITIEELGPLLDAQSPRLQLEASGGNPGATLAGSISTATHGAEFTKPLLVDRVKAVHFVGPGGQQWWIEGAESIADPAHLMARYPGLDAAHIITGNAPVSGLNPQDWLNAVVVSMGCMGVIYSVVMEVFPVQGSEMVTVQTTWNAFLAQVQQQNPSLRGLTIPQILNILRNSADPLHATVNNGIAATVENGSLTTGRISAAQNLYADLAFNPNPAPAGSNAPAPGDWDCWIVNRKTVPMPFDPQPPASEGLLSIVDAVFKRLGKAFAVNNNPGNVAKLVQRLANVYGITHPFHVDIPSPHVDVPPPHIDVASPHIDVPAPHIDVPRPHIDLGHVDVPPPHIDVPPPHIDLGHIDLGHIDLPGVHIDLGHIDVPPPHIDVPRPHIDLGHIDVPPPHIDVPPPHIDVPPPHIDVPPPHIDIGHVDLNTALQGVVVALASPLVPLLTGVLGFVPGAAGIIEALLLEGLDLGRLVSIISRIAGAHDTLDVALDQMTGPLAAAQALDLAQPLLTGVLSSTLGTNNQDGVGVSIGTSVGSVGFPSGGLMGAGLEVALPLSAAFGFMQTHILDKMDPQKPFFGYVSVRICPQTTTLMGMQQWPTSVMIEVVSFGDPWGRQFMSQLQADCVQFMAQGNDAMLHWGLENDQLTAKALASVPAMSTPTVANAGGASLSKLAAFKMVRSLIFSNNGATPSTLFRAFDNAFTTRLNL